MARYEAVVMCGCMEGIYGVQIFQVERENIYIYHAEIMLEMKTNTYVGR